MALRRLVPSDMGDRYQDFGDNQSITIGQLVVHVVIEIFNGLQVPSVTCKGKKKQVIDPWRRITMVM
jgi:hypothetical protein